MTDERHEHVMEHSAKIRERSGKVDYENTLIAFLYRAIRDGDICPGAVENIMMDIEPKQSFEYSNGWLAQYCADVAERML